VSRMPTPEAELYDWHRRALAGEKPPVWESEPKCGWYLARLEARGDLVPGSVWMDQPTDPETGELCGDEVLRCEIGGECRNPIDAWTWLAKRPVSYQEYRSRIRASVAPVTRTSVGTLKAWR
jgi:hypothetical protein